MTRKTNLLPDTHQKYWQLAFIQGSAMGIPILLNGSSFLGTYQPLQIIVSILLGNFIIWALALVMILMTPNRQNAVVNVANYMGKKAMYFAGLILSFAFIGWYSMQTEAAVEFLGYVYDISAAQKLKLGAVLGAIVALISMGGIKLIRWVNCLSFPLFIAFFVFLSFGSKVVHLSISHWEPSFYLVLVIVLNLLPGFVNIPTFFRHAQSKAHAIGGLSLTILINLSFQVYLTLINLGDIKAFASKQSTILSVIFVLLSLLCINLVNIYFSAATWEVALSKYAGAKGYALSGLIGTLFYCALQNSKPMQFVNTIMNGFISNLGLVLLIGYIFKHVVTGKKNIFNPSLSNVCWVVGCAVSLTLITMVPSQQIKGVFWGMIATLLTFIAIIFYKETLWSIKTLMGRRKKD